MDPVTQIALGAAVPLALESFSGAGLPALRRKRARHIFFAGGLGGFLPDADILIRSAADPLTAVQFHRHFTHSVFFAPVIGAVVALALYGLFGGRRSFWLLARWATLGALTHGLLDACTSYGTHLLWPFTNERVSWHIISVIDPLYTFPLLAFVVAATSSGRLNWVRIGLVLSFAYLALGMSQRDSALRILRSEIEKRGQTAGRVVVKPSFGNLWLWRGIYESDGKLHVDAIRNFPGQPPRVYPGGAVSHIQLERDFAHLAPSSVAFHDLQRFRFFSDDYLYFVGDDRNTVGDLRFSLLPNSLEPLWVVTLRGDPEKHLPYITTRQLGPGQAHRFWSMLLGRDG